MTTPSVIEVPAQLEPVEPDPFIDALPPSSDPVARRLERDLRARRVERVRRLLRMRAERGVRNGGTASATDRL
jgi:hypothetical protein